MYSVIAINGHQYKVQPGQSIVVDKLDNEVESLVSYPSLLFVDGKNVKVGKFAATVTVKAKIVKHFKGEKIQVDRFRAKSRYRRRVGFRPHLTELKIEQIGSLAKKAPEIKAAIKPANKSKAKISSKK